MPEVSILIPHLREPENDKALKIAVDCIITHTDADYELIVEAVETRRDVYAVVNDMTRRAKADWVIVSNSDIFVAPGWIHPMLDAADADTIVAGVIVEPGAIGVSALNAHRNFGMTPETFDRTGFEAFVQVGGEWREGDRAWYWPSLHHRDTFLARGGYDTTRGVFGEEPLDKYYWDAWEADGKRFKRVRSFVYHLQNWSNPVEQAKAVRYAP